MKSLVRWKRTSAVLMLFIATAIASPAQTFTTLVDFDWSNGANPLFMSLVQGVNANFYGTTASGGSTPGTIFEITPLGALTTLHNFEGTDGSTPFAGLLLASDGEFYGTTYDGSGAYYDGTIFKITSGGALSTFYVFDGSEGVNPVAALIQAKDGNFYGTTAFGGTNDYGTVFRVTSGGSLTTLHSFSLTDGANPYGGLVQARDGSFYGATAYGGGGSCTDGYLAGCGTIFKITPEGKLTSVHSFQNTDGAFPFAALTQAADGNLYGTTTYGGTLSCSHPDGCGTVFMIAPTGKLTVLHSFVGSDGISPYGSLIQATDGNLYGTTRDGGANGDYGTIYAITTGGALTVLHSFDGADGSLVLGGLVQATDGSFYGATNEGGDYSYGTVFNLAIGLGPFVAFVHDSGRVGQTGGILGQGFAGTTSVSVNGTPANFRVVSDTYIKATVPAGATTGYVTVTTPTGTLTSNVRFQVLP
jgi:uncharacterized repeat protein (TIGR03803 family)